MKLNALALTTLSLSLFAAAAPQKRQRAQVIDRCVEPKTVALTFDDGPWYYIYDISKTLTDNGAKGTFFFNGNNWACIYDQDASYQVKFAYSQGHQVASHTWRHADLSQLSWDEIHDEMWRVESAHKLAFSLVIIMALSRIVGVTPAFMRPPFGSYNDQVLDASGLRGQDVVIWDFDSHDGDDNPPSPEEILDAYNQTLS
uniref:Putative carbohydrate esterase family 4 protein n=1 Tax=Moniliophthora roreri TaxID=221103 RepID=A0A0W0G5K7_MONRR